MNPTYILQYVNICSVRLPLTPGVGAGLFVLTAPKTCTVAVKMEYVFFIQLYFFENGDLNLLINIPLSSIDTFDFYPLAQMLLAQLMQLIYYLILYAFYYLII